MTVRTLGVELHLQLARFANLVPGLLDSVLVEVDRSSRNFDVVRKIIVICKYSTDLLFASGLQYCLG